MMNRQMPTWFFISCVIVSLISITIVTIIFVFIDGLLRSYFLLLALVFIGIAAINGYANALQFPTKKDTNVEE